MTTKRMISKKNKDRMKVQKPQTKRKAPSMLSQKSTTFSPKNHLLPKIKGPTRELHQTLTLLYTKTDKMNSQQSKR